MRRQAGRAWAEPMGPAGPSRKFKVNYYSNTIAIDFRGGEKVSRRSSLSAPGEILLWEPDGTLVVRNELEDKAAIDQLKAAEAPPPRQLGGAARSRRGAVHASPGRPVGQSPRPGQLRPAGEDRSGRSR